MPSPLPLFPVLPASHAPTRARYLLTHVVGVTLLLACLAWWVQASGLDMRIARGLFDPLLDDFPLHGSRWLELLGHRLVLALPVSVGLAAAGVAVASYRIAAWRRWRGVALAIAATCLSGQLLISQLKHHTMMPRPYDLETLGGYTPYPLHWGRLAQRPCRRGLCPAQPVLRGMGAGPAGVALDRTSDRCGGRRGIFGGAHPAGRAFPQPDDLVRRPDVAAGGGLLLPVDRGAGSQPPTPRVSHQLSSTPGSHSEKAGT